MEDTEEDPCVCCGDEAGGYILCDNCPEANKDCDTCDKDCYNTKKWRERMYRQKCREVKRW